MNSLEQHGGSDGPESGFEALYQIAHVDGWDSLIQVKGLEPIGGVVFVQSCEEMLGGDPDEWPEDDLFDHHEDRLLFRQDDVFRS